MEPDRQTPPLAKRSYSKSAESVNAKEVDEYYDSGYSADGKSSLPQVDLTSSDIEAREIAMLSEMGKLILREVSSDLVAENEVTGEPDIESVYYEKLDEVMRFSTREIKESLLPNMDELIPCLSRDSLSYIESLGVRKPPASLDYRWPYAMPEELCQEDDIKYLRKVTPELNLIHHLAYYEKSTSFLSVEQKNHLFVQLVAHVIRLEKIGKCGDKAHVVSDFLMKKIYREKLPVRIGLINIDCENKVIDDVSRKQLKSEVSGANHKKYSKNENKEILVVNQVSVLVFPSDVDTSDFGSLLERSFIIDPYRETCCKGKDFYTTYLPLLEFPEEDLQGLHISFLDDQ